MTKPIPDKAEVALEYPDKFYIGTFERSARFDARFDDMGVSLLLEHPGDADVHKSVHYPLRALFADILRGLAKTVCGCPNDAAHDRFARLRGAPRQTCRRQTRLRVVPNRYKHRTVAHPIGDDAEQAPKRGIAPSNDGMRFPQRSNPISYDCSRDKRRPPPRFGARGTASCWRTAGAKSLHLLD
jgi:hypothetical protein